MATATVQEVHTSTVTLVLSETEARELYYHIDINRETNKEKIDALVKIEDALAVVV